MAKIVVVDDSRLARTFTAACLRKQGHDVQEVEPASLFEVLKTLKELRPDLLVMDFLMPNCPGTSLARVCAEDADLKTMKMVVLTAHHDDEVEERLKLLGVSKVLFKPVEANALAEAVADQLGAP